jgi:twitching motility two-component system response regulator PilH
MQKILIVDDNEGMLSLFRTRLADAYEIIETPQAEEALAMALEHKPDAVILDLMMPQFSGFELCQNIRSLSYTSTIPVFVVSGAGSKYQEQCEKLGAKAYFQKPVDFPALKLALSSALQEKKPERRRSPRVRMSIPIKLLGTDANGEPLEESTVTENASVGGFLCACSANLIKGTKVKVILSGETERVAGTAEVVRREAPNTPWQRYGFHLFDRTSEWIFQEP